MLADAQVRTFMRGILKIAHDKIGEMEIPFERLPGDDNTLMYLGGTPLREPDSDVIVHTAVIVLVSETEQAIAQQLAKLRPYPPV